MFSSRRQNGYLVLDRNKNLDDAISDVGDTKELAKAALIAFDRSVQISVPAPEKVLDA